MQTILVALIVASTLQNNQTSHAITRNSNAVMLYDAKASHKYQKDNAAYCRDIRNSIYADSDFLEQPQDRLPNDFYLISEQTQMERVKNSLKKFDEIGCDQNNYVHKTDRDLFKKLQSDLQK